MSMLMPTRNNRFFNNLMLDPFDAFFDTTPTQKSTPALMRTDIRETDAGYELTIDLPGFGKDDVKAQLKDGYLTINAQTSSETEDKDDAGTWVRKERFTGSCSRSFYVGEDCRKTM